MFATLVKRTASDLLLAGGLFGLVAFSASAQELAAPVEVDLVIGEPLSQTMPVIGRFVAVQEGGVASQISAPVLEMLVKVGDRVSAGDVIVLLDPLRFQQSRALQAARLEGARSALKTAQLSFSLSKQELSRLEKLKGSAAFSKARFDDKVKNVARELSLVSEVEAEMVEARANLNLSQLDLEDTEIKAPYNGVIVQTHTEAGAYVSSGFTVVEIINDEDMEIEADVPSARIPALEQGRVVSFSLLSGAKFDAIVRASIPVENALTRTRAVRFTPALGDAYHGKIADGETATVYIPVGSARDIISVHKDAVMPSANGQYVYVVLDGKAVQRPVKLGEPIGGRFEVLGGLKLGDVVIVKGNERLYPNQPVKYEGMPLVEGLSDTKKNQSSENQSG